MSAPAKDARRVVVLGALSAIAEATCRRLAEAHAHLALLARDERRLGVLANDLTLRGAGRVITRSLDLSSADAAPDRVISELAAELSGIDTVLIFYGVLGDQAAAEADLTQAREILNVNFVSQALWSLAAANHLARAGDKRAVLLVASSVAGDRGRMSNYIYGAAKGGLTILLQGLAHRLGHQKGPRVVAAKIGLVDTPMTAAMKKGGALWATPDDVSRALVHSLERGGPIIYVPWFWRWIMLVIRLIPAPLFHRLRI